MKLICEARQTDVQLRPRASDNTRPPSDSTPGYTDCRALPFMPSSHGRPDGDRWRESSRQGSARATSSPGAVSTSQLPDEEPIVPFHDSSMSSQSSALSTDRPYTPTAQPINTPHSLPFQFDSKLTQVSDTHISDHEPPGRPIPSVGSSIEATCPNGGCYQCVEHPVHPNPAQHQQYSGVESRQEGYLGPDGLLHMVYSAPVHGTGQPHPTQGHNYPYPSNTPYSYS